MRKQNITYALGIILALMIILNAAHVSAITGSIGSARMTLRAEVGEEVERSILVRNVNDVAVNINVTASGDLAENVNLDEDNFDLEAGEEKKVYFTIEADEEGTTETRITIKFTPIEGGNGVVLSSVVNVIAAGEGSVDDSEEEDLNDTEDGNDFNFGIGSSDDSDSIDGEDRDATDLELSPLNMLMISTIVLIIILVILIVWASKKRNKRSTAVNKTAVKKRSGRPSE